MEGGVLMLNGYRFVALSLEILNEISWSGSSEECFIEFRHVVICANGIERRGEQKP